MQRAFSSRVATLTVKHLYTDRNFFNLANASAPVNAKFEGITTGVAAKSAQFLLYSGVIDEFQITQSDGNLFEASVSMHANEWSAVGQ